jgi:protein-disulfide isomerase
MQYMLKRAATFLVVFAALSAPALAQEALKPTAEDHVLGKPDAPITILEYASLTCPHCAAFHRETLPQVKKDWIDTGKAKLVFRHFPFDRAALSAAQLTECAGPDKYFTFLDVLFQQQETWVRGDPTANLTRIAKLGGIPEDKVQACLKDEKLANKIVAGRLQGEKELGVNSTPTFFINGRKVVGAEPYEQFNTTLKAVEKQ